MQNLGSNYGFWITRMFEKAGRIRIDNRKQNAMILIYDAMHRSELSLNLGKV